jgi:hypothetical protein
MAQRIHFKIFSCRGSKGGWNLVEVKNDRDEAVRFAQELMKDSVTGVKVVKETHCEATGDYLTLKIFEDGHNKIKLAQENARQALRDAQGRDQKVFRLIALMDQAPAEEPGRHLLLSTVDTIIAELLGGSAALRVLIGRKNNLGGHLMSLVELFLGKEPEESEGRQGLTSLARRFARDELPQSRSTIADRIMAGFRSAKRLRPESLEDELKTLRQIANAVVAGASKYLSHEDAVAALKLRSTRLLTHETLSEYLAAAALPDEKLERLISLEENVIGVENKRHLATFVMPIITALSFEAHFLDAKQPVPSRLQRLAALCSLVRQSGFEDIQKDDICDALDRIACDVEARTKLFDSIDAKHVSHVEKANTLLRLFAAGTFTEPRLSAKARELVIRYLAKPGFMSGYIAGAFKLEGELIDPNAAVADLMQLLAKAGITEKTGLKSIAA